MKSRNLVKVIFFVSALINLSPTGKATELFANETRNSSQSKSVNWVKKVVPKYTNYSRNISFQKYIDNYSSDSKDYGDFINSKISLNWKKRSYEFGIFYQPHNEAGGISFTLFGFE